MKSGERHRALCISVLAAAVGVCIASQAAADPPTCTVEARPSPASQVAEGTSVTITAQGSNKDVTYLWQQTSGPDVSFDATKKQLVFVAPEVGPGGAVLAFRLTVTGCDATQTATAVVTVNVTNSNEPPLAAIAVSPDPAREGDVVTLDGSASNDPDGDPLTYAWNQTGGPAVTLSNTSSHVVSFTAPAVTSAGASLMFTLTVKDGALTNSKEVIVSVVNINQPPVTSITCPQTVHEDATATLAVNATDDEQIASYSWTHTEGAPSITSDDWSSASFSFTAPKLGPEEGLLTFRVVVTDNLGLSADATCKVQIDDVTAPVLTLPRDITAEATSPDGAAVAFDGTATDAHDGDVSVDCVPPSTTTFPLGPTTVNCSATDTAGNKATGSFQVTTVDTTPPSLSLPSDITVEATGPSGAAASYTASATDVVDGSVSVTCAPPSGATFELGSTTVSCQATDQHANTANDSFVVLVRDTTPPSLTLPANMNVEATGPAGAVASFTASASDIVDGSVSVTCTPASGATFGLGSTTVSCRATDKHGNQGTGSFNVVVQDTTPPALTVPAEKTVEATGAAGAMVSFAASAIDIVDGNVPVTCLPASGSTFALGATTVNCTAKDTHDNVTNGSFTVLVRDTTPPAIQSHLNEVVILGSALPYFTPPTATDVVDGQVKVTCTPEPSVEFALGSTTVTCSAADAHGNTSTSHFTVTVAFAPAGLCAAGFGHQVLQPIALTGTSVFRQTGSTVPVKFRVCDASGNSYHAVNPVTGFQLVQVITGTVSSEPNGDLASAVADSSFRWSEADQFWILNLSTKTAPFEAGATYVFQVMLRDGSKIVFQFGLK